MKKLLTNLRPEVLGANVFRWFDERIDLSPVVALAEKKTVPIHRQSWIYCLGGAALFLFMLQVATGAMLMLYYQPTEVAAHESVSKIAAEVPFGWFVRSLHAWGADLFIAVVCLHFLTVLFTRAYRKPRELTWLTGMVMLLLALAFGFSGYLLPWSELSYYATRVGTQIPGTIPGIGQTIVQFLRGGEQVSGETITRFYAGHVMILPLTLGAFVFLHVMLIQFQGMSLPSGMKESDVKRHDPFFSEFMPVELCVWLVLLAALATVSVFLPVEVGPEADPLKPAPEGIKPEWYFLFMFQTLKYVPEMVGVALFSLVGLFLLAVPFFDTGRPGGLRARGFTFVFVVLMVYAIVFQIVAILAPGVDETAVELDAKTYNLTTNVPSLVLLWGGVGFLAFYLRQLQKQNRQVRILYRGQEP